MLKGKRAWLEKVPIGHIKGNLNIKINVDSDR